MAEVLSFEPPAPLQGDWRRWRTRAGWIAGAAGALLAVVVALASYRYVFDLPPIPENVAANRFRPVWLVLHAGFAATALLVGAVQFSKTVRQRRAAVHRWVGRVYVASCFVGAAAGLVLAVGTSAGPIAAVGFGSLSIAWIVTNALGLQRARARGFAAHRRWMIRSWALTLSAVTLRVYIPLFAIAGMPEMPAYRLISFLAWVPNLLVAEWLLRREGVQAAA